MKERPEFTEVYLRHGRLLRNEKIPGQNHQNLCTCVHFFEVEMAIEFPKIGHQENTGKIEYIVNP